MAEPSSTVSLSTPPNFYFREEAEIKEKDEKTLSSFSLKVKN